MLYLKRSHLGIRTILYRNKNKMRDIIKIQHGRKLRTRKIVGLSIVGFILLFSIISMVIVMFIYNGHCKDMCMV